jgi:hypothetical protein
MEGQETTVRLLFVLVVVVVISWSKYLLVIFVTFGDVCSDVDDH